MEPSRKEQIFIVTTVAVLLLGGVAFGVAQFFWMGAPAQLPASTVAINRSMSVSSPMISSSAAPIVPMTADALAKFNKAYSLADNEVLKRIPKPFIPERDMFVRSQGSSSSVTPSFIVWRWDGSKVTMGTRGPSTTSNYRLMMSTTLSIVAGLQPTQYEVPSEFMSIDLIGDWIVRTTATEEQKMQSLGPIIGAAVGKKLHFSKQPVDRDVVTASGQFAFKPMDDAPDNTSVHFFIDKADFAAAAANGPVSNTRMPVSDMVRYIGTIANIQVTPDLQGDVSNTTVPIRIYSQSLLALRQPGDHSEALKKFLDNIAQQTGLTFKTETKKIDAWALIPD